MEFDIKITGGTLLDGTGAPGVQGDLGIRDGRIVALGEAAGTAAQTLDATGRVVAPGFVDIHTHYDAQILWDRMLSISPWHGVTTVVMGNCGFGVAPTRPEHRELILRTLEKVEGMSLSALQEGLGDDWGFESFPEYLDAVEARGSAIHVAALFGHTPLRLYVMGEASTERAATPDEVAQMRQLVDEGLAAGAVGFATSKAPTHVGYSGRPVPSRMAEFEEIRSLAGALGERGGVMQATLGRELFLDEFAKIAEETGRTISWTALLAGAAGPEFEKFVLEKTAEQQAAGLAIVPQVSCRPLNFEFQWKEPFPFESMKSFAPVSATDHAGKRAIYADPAFRAQFRESGESGLGTALAQWWERTVVTHSPAHPSLDEQPLEAVARERGVHPLDCALDLGLESDLEARFRTSIMNFDEEVVGGLLQNPQLVLGLSDAGAHASQLCDACFSTHLLGHWVRDRGVLELPEAVRMLTSRPADVFGLVDRGRLALGLPADVVVFDPDTVGAGPLERVHDQPSGADRLVAEAHGIDSVLVAGTLVRRDGKDALDPDGPLPGNLLRNGCAPAA
ncbi:MAG: amidohydrolase family protein [Myxococcota bacterium]|nr:amidohydrolase family protein [Myxococcota bacterium]